jgi:GntR family transcriptional regulator
METDSVIGALLFSLHVDKDGATPVYHQIAEKIRRLVREGTLPAGTQLPPERVVCEHANVSKMTLRQAYGLLEREGIIESRRGVGTVVCQPRVDKKLPEMLSFSEEMAGRGKTASSRLLSFTVTDPSFPAREFLNLSDQQKVYEIQRLRMVDGQPIAIERVELPAGWLPNLERYNLEERSLYRILEEHYGIQLAGCREEISAAMPDRNQRKLLGIDRPMALLVIKRQSYAANASPIEYSVTAYRGDLYTASIEAIRSSTGAPLTGMRS